MHLVGIDNKISQLLHSTRGVLNRNVDQAQLYQGLTVAESFEYVGELVHNVDVVKTQSL